jgi:hypothetical protein
MASVYLSERDEVSEPVLPIAAVRANRRQHKVSRICDYAGLIRLHRRQTLDGSENRSVYISLKETFNVGLPFP